MSQEVDVAEYRLKSKKDIDDDFKYGPPEGHSKKKKKKDKKKKTHESTNTSEKSYEPPPEASTESSRDDTARDSQREPPSAETSLSQAEESQLSQYDSATYSDKARDKSYREESGERSDKKPVTDRSQDWANNSGQYTSNNRDRKSEGGSQHQRRDSYGRRDDSSFVEDHDESIQKYDGSGRNDPRPHQRQLSGPRMNYVPGRGFETNRRRQETPGSAGTGASSHGASGWDQSPQDRSWGDWGQRGYQDGRRRSIPSPQDRGASNMSGKGKHSLVPLSKSLSSILRHNAEKMGLTFQDGGFLYVDDVLALPQLKKYTLDDLCEVVDTNEKRRFHMEEAENGRLRIRANQGHSVQITGLDLTPITDPTQFSEVVHGTYLRNWNTIKTTGLSRMSRTHIHFAPGVPGEDQVISGMRGSCDVIIYLDFHKALQDGLQFFLSANNVILSTGNEDGMIPPEYFTQVLDRKTKQRLL